MKKLNKNDCIKIVGGSINYSSSFINAICRMVDIIFEIGKSFGSTIRRNVENNTCSSK